MKRLFILFGMMVLLLSACSSGSDSPVAGGEQLHELTLRESMSGTIASKGEVDWYHFRAVETNSVLQVHCTSNTLRPDVDLLVSVYETDTAGNKVLVYADHAPDGGTSPADLSLATFIDQPRDIYISVRDLMDDDASNEPYYIRIDFSAAPEGNDTFAQAARVTPDGGDCPTERISSVGDVDCFRFSSTGNIYDLNVDFSALADTPVQLYIKLYSSDGTLLERQTSRTSREFHLRHFLPAGEYYVEAEDYGQDQFDNASTYQVCVTTVSGVEAGQNDDDTNATLVTANLFGQDYAINGSLDYKTDQDWYFIDSSDVVGGFKVINASFQSASQVNMLINVVDTDGNTLMSHTYHGGGDTYQTQIKLDAADSDAYLVIQPASDQNIAQSAPYAATVRMLNILDDAEVAPNANDTIADADPLELPPDPGASVQGKIGYRTDVDWYALTVPAHADYQVLEFSLQAPVSQVEYTMSISQAQLLKRLYNMEASTTATQLKTSFLVPPSGSDLTYTVKIGDYHDDDGDDATYTLSVGREYVPAALMAAPAGSPPNGQAVTYWSEAAEAVSPDILEVNFNSLTQKNFHVNTSELAFGNATVQADTPSAGLTTLTFPWVGGYVDYQGDYDFFMVDLQSYDGADSWYYDIQVEIYSPAGPLEYVWKFFHNPDDDWSVEDRPGGYYGFMASAGDDDVAAQELNMTTPSGDDDPFWMGSGWAGKAFFSISDFDYVENEDGTPYTTPDDDWGGYDAIPYYFRITLVYHPGVATPE